MALNAERAAEEAQGHIRWLRPAYQAPPDSAPRTPQPVLIQEDSPLREVFLAARPLLWPSRMAEQAQAVRRALVALGRPASAAQVTAAFAAAPAEPLETLVMLGQTRAVADERYMGQPGVFLFAQPMRFPPAFLYVGWQYDVSLPPPTPDEPRLKPAWSSWPKILWSFSTPSDKMPVGARR